MELKRKSNGLTMIGTALFINKFGILSGPDPLEVLNVDMTLIMSSSEILEKMNFLESLLTLWIPLIRGLGLLEIFSFRSSPMPKKYFIYDVRDFIFTSNNLIINYECQFL